MLTTRSFQRPLEVVILIILVFRWETEAQGGEITCSELGLRAGEPGSLAIESMLNCHLCCLYAAGIGESKTNKQKAETTHRQNLIRKKEKLGSMELEVEVRGLTPRPSRELFFPLSGDQQVLP